ncbi:MAG TPA: methyltransferase regulatory domain-containing protein [Thermoanaerobaculia bacterium]|nr:methyltransferase regulatory domain-containing protein [Thermoanaerobaculia bacterium]
MSNLSDSARQAEERLRRAYDEVPYQGSAIKETHPAHLGAIATLFGLEPAPFGACRVLELGCGDGGNLLPMAAAAPGSTFVGIDLSPRQIAAGQAAAADLGLANLELRVESLLDFEPGPEPFDYLLVHGVFSWVGPREQERILELCREALAGHGVAYVSYNTYPGWHQREMLRSLMLWVSRDEGDLERRRVKAVAWVEKLAAATAAGGKADPHALFLAETREHLADYDERPTYLIHEYLEEANSPLYFHRFVARAGAHGLAYLADADPASLEPEPLPAALAAHAAEVAADRLEVEQLLDFLHNRSFRRSLLVRREAALTPAADAGRVSGLAVASAVRIVEQGSAPSQPPSFQTLEGRSFRTAHPIAQAALLGLTAAWPGTLSFEGTLAAARERWTEVGGEGELAAPRLAEFLLASFVAGVVSLHRAPFAGGARPGTRPEIFAAARWRAAAGALVPNLYHRALKLDDDLARLLLPLADGSRDRAALAAALAEPARAGRLKLEAEGRPIDDPKALAALLPRLVDHHLARAAELGLVVG